MGWGTHLLAFPLAPSRHAVWFSAGQDRTGRARPGQRVRRAAPIVLQVPSQGPHSLAVASATLEVAGAKLVARVSG